MSRSHKLFIMNNQQFDLIIRPDKGLDNVLKELWCYRELFLVLAWRDFKVRYKQTVIGILWAFLRPLLTAVVFTIVFSKVAGLPQQGDIPYALTVLAAMIPWFFFAGSFQEGSNALITNAGMISKVYFPRIIVPVSSMFVNFIDLCISLVILGLLMVYFQFMPSSNIVYLPGFLLLAALFTVAATLWMSALNVKYRDVRFVVPFIVQFGLYVSPVGFATEVITNEWRFVYSLNPMVGVIDGFRWCLLGQDIEFYWPSLVMSIVISLVMLAGGYLFFSKTERKFADIV